jgi:hypothetical protein
MQEASRALFKADRRPPALPEIAAYYRERRMACVVFTVDAESATGVPGVPNEEVAQAAADNPDVMIPFASIDPARGKAGVAQARLITEFGARFKFHPSVFVPMTGRLPAVCGDRGTGRAGGFPHRADRDRRRHPGRGRYQAEVLESAVHR